MGKERETRGVQIGVRGEYQETVSTRALMVMDERVKRPSTPDQLPLPLSNACRQGQDYRAEGFILRSRIQERRVNDSISMFSGKNVLIVGHLWKEHRCPSLSIEV